MESFINASWDERWAVVRSAVSAPDFLWPDLLWLLLAIPLLVLAYLWLLRRQRRIAVRYASLSVVREALGSGPGWRRHVPPALLLLALACMLVAAARPVAMVTLPSQQRTILLAMDVSISMRASDVQPNRMVAAQEAAKAFITSLPRQVKVGIVAFAGSAQVAQLPTQSRDDLLRAIDSFQLQRGTATGNGLMLSLATLFPHSGLDIIALDSRMSGMGGGGFGGGRPSPLAGRGMQGVPEQPPPVPPGSYTSAAIVMLTDGRRTTGVDPLQAAQLAADRGVRVYTVGVGTKEGETVGFEGWSMRVTLDEETLKAIAAKTSAEYFYAGNAPDLKKIYETLSSRLAVERRETEVSALFALAAAVLALLAAGLSVWRYGRIA
ncbi:MAG: VWA domain-containing protein [Xylophilus ampelinus]